MTGWFNGQEYFLKGIDHPVVVGPFAVVFAENLWVTLTGWFSGQSYFLVVLEHPVIGPFALVVAEDL